jgi:hypothetical protein
MKNSEKLYYAMLSVLNSDFDDDTTLEVLALLIDKRNSELFYESADEKEDKE